MAAEVQSDCLADEIASGDVVGGKYKVQAIIGKGGMGLVVAAEHLQLGEKVALKFLTATTHRVPAARERFMREARVTAKLRGEHAARVSDFGTLDDGTPYMVMEFLEGRDLRQLLREKGRLSVDVAVHYIVQACEGLAQAHTLGIVHRDLKPSNLFLTQRPDGTDLIKLVDFGISKVRSAHDGHDVELTAAGAILGSPKYVAPEQLRDSGCVDTRADLWSLGAIFYEMLSGVRPFEGDSAAALCFTILNGKKPKPIEGQIEGVTRNLQNVIWGCLTHDLDQRTPNVAALVADLHDATGIDGLDVVARSLAGMLDRGEGENLEGTGSNPRALRTFGSATDSGALRSLENSGGTQPGLATSRFPPSPKGKPVWLFVAAGVLLASVMGAFLWTFLSSDSRNAVAPVLPEEPPHELVDVPSSASSESMDAAVDAAEEGGPEASTEASTEASRPIAPVRTSRPVQGGTRTPKIEPTVPPKNNNKKPDPFGERY